MDFEEAEVAPAVRTSRTGERKGTTAIAISETAGRASRKEAEEEAAAGHLINVVFRLPDGTLESASFPVGQDIISLKAHLHKTKGYSLSAQKMTHNGAVLIDPMSLADYPAIASAKGPVSIEVALD